jgi:hypothetical protein
MPRRSSSLCHQQPRENQGRWKSKRFFCAVRVVGDGSRGKQHRRDPIRTSVGFRGMAMAIYGRGTPHDGGSDHRFLTGENELDSGRSRAVAVWSPGRGEHME